MYGYLDCRDAEGRQLSPPPALTSRGKATRRKSLVPSALNLMKAGPTRSIASRSQRSISTIRQVPAIREAITFNVQATSGGEGGRAAPADRR